VSAWPERGRAPLGALMTRAASWLIAPPEAAEPAWPPCARPSEPVAGPAWAPPGSGAADPSVWPERPTAAHGPPDPAPPRPVVAVLGLAPRAGTSTVARAVAARLAAFDPGRAAVLHTSDIPRAGVPTAAAARLARALAAGGSDAPRATGRLCVVPADEPLAPLAASRPAPVVADLAHGRPAEGAVVLADHVVLVAPAGVEPALAGAVETSLRAAGASLSMVLARVTGEPPPELARALVVPESRLAAQLTLGCREPRGVLGAVAAELAERSLAEVWR
jgi:hypothetical protein